MRIWVRMKVIHAYLPMCRQHCLWGWLSVRWWRHYRVWIKATGTLQTSFPLAERFSLRNKIHSFTPLWSFICQRESKRDFRHDYACCACGGLPDDGKSEAIIDLHNVLALYRTSNIIYRWPAARCMLPIGKAYVGRRQRVWWAAASKTARKKLKKG